MVRTLEENEVVGVDYVEHCPVMINLEDHNVVNVEYSEHCSVVRTLEEDDVAMWITYNIVRSWETSRPMTQSLRGPRGTLFDREKPRG